MPGDFSQDTVEAPEPAEGQFLARTLWLSLDPYLRNVMKGHALYGVALRPGDPMHGESVAEVVDSRHPDFAAGEFVLLKSGWQEYALSNGAGVRKVDPTLAPVSTALGVLGMPGLTGYAGLVYLGEPRPGQTVLVSAATGPVGSTVGQVARLTGARENARAKQRRWGRAKWRGGVLPKSAAAGQNPCGAGCAQDKKG